MKVVSMLTKEAYGGFFFCFGRHQYSSDAPAAAQAETQKSERCLVSSILTSDHGRVVVATPCAGAALPSATKKASGFIRTGVPCRAAIAIVRTRSQVRQWQWRSRAFRRTVGVQLVGEPSLPSAGIHGASSSVGGCGTGWRARCRGMAASAVRNFKRLGKTS